MAWLGEASAGAQSEGAQLDNVLSGGSFQRELAVGPGNSSDRVLRLQIRPDPRWAQGATSWHRRNGLHRPSQRIAVSDSQDPQWCDEAPAWLLASGRARRENGTMAQGSVDLDSLSPAEQLDLLEQLWDRLSENPANLQLTAEQAQVLDQRDADLDRDVQAGRSLGQPWSEVRKRLG
jgi:putative addiction module component (TIGR02574 family)